MIKEKMIIIIPAHSSYLDVAVIFEKIFYLKWPDCPFKIIISTNDCNAQFEKFVLLKNKNSDEFIRRIYNAAKKYPANYYLILNEDRFLSQNIDDEIINNVISYLDTNNIDFCRFIPSNKKKKLYFSKLKKNKPYGLNVAGCICNDNFLNDHMKENINGWEYENNELLNTLLFSSKDYYDKYVEASYDFLVTLHGIQKGKWKPLNYKKLKKLYPTINFDIRDVEKISFSYALKSFFSHIARFISPKVRYKIKSMLNKFGMTFSTKC